MAIYLDGELAGRLAARLLDGEEYAEFGRYTGKVMAGGYVKVYAWANNTARIIGWMTPDAEHAISVVVTARMKCTCGASGPDRPAGSNLLGEWKKHVESK